MNRLARAYPLILCLAALMLMGVAPCGGDDDPAPATDGGQSADATTNKTDTGAKPDSATTKPEAGSTKCAGNPLATSCFTEFMNGCWAPDMTGKCTDTGLTLSWSDGHKVIRAGAVPGFYKPGQSTPCFSFSYELATKTATYKKGGKTIVVVQKGDVHTTTCPDGKKETYTTAQGLAWNKCVGLLCP